MRAPPVDGLAVVPGHLAGGLGPAQVGHKAANLAWLAARGSRVPPFAVVTADACALLLEPAADEIRDRLAQLDCEDAASLRLTSKAIRDAVAGLMLPEAVGRELAAQVAELGGHGPFAVRSSSVGQDSTTDSFAGQLDTLLNVSAAGLDAAVLACLASAYSERALFYRARRGLGNGGVRSAVIVQVLVDSAVAGVAFTCNPQSGDTGEAVVVAGLGLGQEVVSGTADSDTFFVDVRSGRVTGRHMGDKRTRVVLSALGGTTAQAVAGGDATAPALTDGEVAGIVAEAVELAGAAGCPQDVEWALDGDRRLHLLQARPVTSAAGQQTIFDNVNVTESYPGMTLPLTFSFVRRCYELIFRNCQRDFGATKRVMEAGSADLFPYLIGFVHGRVYYNISNWYRMFLMVPGLERAIPAWEAALGIENRYQRPAEPRRGLARVGALMWELRTVGVLLSAWLRLRGRIRLFSERYEQFRSELERRPPAELSGHELLALLDRFLADLLPLYAVQIFNDFLAQQLFELVAMLIGRYGISDDAVGLRNELFCGEAGVDSVDPVRSALRLTERIRRDRALRALFEGPTPAGEVWRQLGDDPRFASFHGACLDHIRGYGDRTLEELKIETDTLDERPEDLVPMLRNYLRGGQNVEEMEARERRIRRGAEARVAATLRGRPGRRMLFHFVLHHARWGVKQRENLRLGRSRCFGFAKRVYRALGHRMAEAGLIDEPRDVFWLTREEVEAVTRGIVVDRDLTRLVESRKADYAAWEDEQLPSRIVTSGIVAAHTHDADLTMPDEATVLQGVGCSPGAVEAPALALREPDSTVRVDGEILVAAATDPGWVFLMVAAGGLVSEKGSVLSHTAIIGRELGIPTVVGVKQATQLLAGHVVALDGGAGTVTITDLPRARASGEPA